MLDVLVTDFEANLQAFSRRLTEELAGVAFDLGEEAQSLTQKWLDILVYNTPERNYERTGRLRESAYGYGQMTPTGFDVVLGAVGGAGGRAYAAPVNTGSYGSRIDRDQLLADARGDSSFNPRSYPRAGSGVEARAFAEAAIAEVERRAEDKVLGAVDRAWG